MIEQGGWYDELEAGKKVWKEPGGEPVQTKVPQDTTKALVETLNLWQADCFVTSGHATEHNWQLGYRYKNGYFKCEKGVLYGEDTAKGRHPVNSPNPKVYLPIGNCLMGHIDGPDAMALAWMNSAGVNQMIGYIQPTWFGYAGWGTLDYFIEQPGRFTFIEAFFANHHALIHKLRSEPSKGLEFDRDHVAVYGDPAWIAKMAPQECRWQQTLTEEDGAFTLTITPNRGRESFLPVNTNGSQRGGRPVIAYLPRRNTGNPVIIQGAEYKPVITDDFILVPNPGSDYDGEPIEIRFRAEAAGTAAKR
jgi:zinc protease